MTSDETTSKPDNHAGHRRRAFLRNLTLAGVGLGLTGSLTACANGTGPTAPTTDQQKPTNNTNKKAKPMSYTLPQLPYAYNAIEPYIDAQTMELHHSKHHNAYVTNLNAALAKEPAFSAPECPAALIADLAKVPESIRTAVRNNGGGHVNHSFFWKLIAPSSANAPAGALADAVNKTFGSLDGLKEKFAAAATTRFGSGWAWLIVKEDKTLAVVSTPNQDSPLMKGTADAIGRPVLALDVWEHAYYLKYQNRRADYIGAFWNIVNWEFAGEKYQKALA